MKTILITGANGFLGKALCSKLIESYVIVPVTRATGTDLGGMFKNTKIDYIIHAATFYGRSYEGATELIESNILLPLRVCEMGIKQGTKAFINADTFFNCEQNYDYLTGYIKSKKQVNEWLKTLSNRIPIINMKIQHMYGLGEGGDKFIPQLLEKLIAGKEMPLTMGEQKRDFIYIDDVVSAYLTILAHIDTQPKGFITYNIGTGKSISIKELCLTVKQLANSNSNLIFGALSYRENEIMDSFADNSILKELGWEPKISLEEGIKKIIG